VLDTVIGQIEDESRRSSKSHLISQAANLIQIAQQVCKQPMPSVVTISTVCIIDLINIHS